MSGSATVPAPTRSVTAALVATVLCAACAAAAPVASRPVPVTPASAAGAAPVVLLDPGHNGGNADAPERITRRVPDGRGGRKPCNTTGTATDAGYPEHAFAWDLAQRVRARLERSGVRVVLTRGDDRGVGPCVDARGAAGARTGAQAAVSLHADGAAPSARGFHVVHADPPVRGGERSVRLATALRDALRDARFPPARHAGSAGLDARDDLAGLNHSTVPTALVEAANMRHPEDARLVSTPAGRDRYADAVAAGVLAFLGR